MASVFQSNQVRRLSLLGVVFAFVSLVGCDLAGDSDSATIRVLLTDAPFPFEMVDSANVTIDRVELVSESEGVVNVTADWTEAQKFNLLELRNGVTALLGEIEIPAGTYEQIRLILDGEATVVMKEEAGGAVYNMRVPSGAETGLKILLDSLTAASESFITLTLDFDVAESFVVLGDASTPAGVEGFNFKPVVKVLEVELAAAADDAGE